jgi:transposase
MHPKTLIRRTHSPEFKARVLAACRQPGASIAAVALAHGINANVVRKWLVGIGMKRSSQHLPAEAQSPIAPVQFLPVGLSPNGPEHAVAAITRDIRLDLDLGAVQIKLHCPRGSAPSAAALLHALAEMVARA